MFRGISTAIITFLGVVSNVGAHADDVTLARAILADPSLDAVVVRARELVATGYSAGEGYKEVWIRDLNTFMDLACAVRPAEEVKEQLRTFFRFQGADGNIVDGFVPEAQAGVGYDYIRADSAPGYLAHKNTVETDQESSLVQAVARYVRATGDRAFLREEIDGKGVCLRLAEALRYVRRHRFSEEYGLVWGATTADWGDVQPEHPWGVKFDESSHPAIDIYDNALYVIALEELASLGCENLLGLDGLAQQVKAAVREHLWDAARQKFRPHVYLEGSPFPADFDEDAIYYHGGTGVAIAAGILGTREVATSLEAMRANMQAAGAATIGLTVYPPYPDGFFKNPSMGAYSYQNGGDWTWFGARTVTALAEAGFVAEAYHELRPMIARVLANEGFYEWYSRENEPRGSGQYRGSAGVLYEAIQTLRTWARRELEPVTLSRAEFRDKALGAWVGQMVGVCYGAPYEFVSNGLPILEPMQPWRPERLLGAIDQDDCYVEMTFLKSLGDHGIGITPEQAGRDFGESKYELWHANRVGRDNVRAGILPPMSGHPDHNHHADDIDFQIEADLFGIVAPGLPQAANQLCDVFGHIMNYGDGVYGGMFVAGMYAAAYFEPRNVWNVIDAGLAGIPDASLYEQCIRDVIAWHRESPQDWQAVWQKIEDKWQDDVDCSPGNPFNIDAKLNGAYIVMGLLYGDGDFEKTMEIATRCGQDADCNPSNAVGVLGCMYGFSGIPAEFRAGLDAVRTTNFSYTEYNLDTLIPACERIAEQLVVAAGGKATDEAFVFTRQVPVAAPLEQWENQQERLNSPISGKEVLRWKVGWQVRDCGADMAPGVYGELAGREHVLVIHPKTESQPAVAQGWVKVPDDEKPVLVLPVRSHPQGDWKLVVKAGDTVLHEQMVNTQGEWEEVPLDLGAYRGELIERLRFENHATGWAFEAAYLGRPEFR